MKRLSIRLGSLRAPSEDPTSTCNGSLRTSGAQHLSAINEEDIPSLLSGGDQISPKLSETSPAAPVSVSMTQPTHSNVLYQPDEDNHYTYDINEAEAAERNESTLCCEEVVDNIIPNPKLQTPVSLKCPFSLKNTPDQIGSCFHLKQCQNICDSERSKLGGEKKADISVPVSNEQKQISAHSDKLFQSVALESTAQTQVSWKCLSDLGTYNRASCKISTNSAHGSIPQVIKPDIAIKTDLLKFNETSFSKPNAQEKKSITDEEKSVNMSLNNKKKPAHFEFNRTCEIKVDMGDSTNILNKLESINSGLEEEDKGGIDKKNIKIKYSENYIKYIKGNENETFGREIESSKNNTDEAEKHKPKSSSSMSEDSIEE